MEQASESMLATAGFGALGDPSVVEAPMTPGRKPARAPAPQSTNATAHERNCSVVSALSQHFNDQPHVLEGADALLRSPPRSRHLLLLALHHCCVTGELTLSACPPAEPSHLHFVLLRGKAVVLGHA